MPSILEQGQQQVRDKIQELESVENNDAISLSVDPEQAQLTVEKNWRNGWGIVAWAQTYWTGEWTAGGKIKKTF